MGLQVERPEQVWVSDITNIRLRDDFVDLAVVTLALPARASVDVFTRSIRGWHLGRTLHQELTLTALQRALAAGRRPEIHHSDQGVQYAASAYIDALKSTSINMAKVGEAWQNGYAERLTLAHARSAGVRTIKEEEVDLSDYHDYQDAYRQLGRFPDEIYIRKRIHSSLGYLTPAEFESQWLARQARSAELV